MDVHGISDAKEKLVAALGMVACCGLAMAVATGVLVISSGLLLGGVAILVGLGCAVFMLRSGHHHGHDDESPESTEACSSI